MSESIPIAICQSAELKSITRCSPRIRAVNSTFAIGKNEFFLSIFGFNNRVTLDDNYGRVEIIGDGNVVEIERDYTNWICNKGNNEIRVKQSCLSEGKSIIEEAIDNCIICYNQYHIADSNVQIMKCRHAMHKECFNQYTFRYNHCPLCKSLV